MTIEVPSVEPAEFALRVAVHGDGSGYFVYLIDSNLADVSGELNIELETIMESPPIQIVGDATALVEATKIPGALMVDATGYSADDWKLLDRRRSSLARSTPIVFLTTREVFALLMQHATNLASWLAGNVFRTATVDRVELVRQQRLTALREWFGQSDEEMVQLAKAGELPAEPEYAEWLVLLGRQDLLHSEHGDE